ncbi:MAG: hypothetical protein KKF79_13600 [Gammaproteobacteria bacterium]|jgi:hypothetical protein|nr:hypothetical protein [Gammaproteobacteria bacterium]MBU2222827.1 hypothetical protein [Gammaproteobacteria bacterium]MBU2277590.1 hypothetical protein [Gammaproteobacteria bacterium]MBU2426776.1 hypothetical protein [Gammaproteobacteria bacterium]
MQGSEPRHGSAGVCDNFFPIIFIQEKIMVMPNIRSLPLDEVVAVTIFA